MSTHWRLTFTPVDSWYFRESRPHGAAGADRLESLFPPPVRTVAGAIRTRIGECLDVDWQTFREGEACFGDISINELLGDSVDTGSLSFSPVAVTTNNQPLFSWPACLLEKKSLATGSQSADYVRLVPGSPVMCDLGNVRLPELAQPCSGAKVPERDYLDQTLLQKILAGGLPADSGKGITRQSDLFSLEPRLGIGLDKQSATVEQGLLYQTSHLRLADEVAVSILVSGLPEIVAKKMQENLQASPFIRFGAEGRMARVTLQPEAQPALPDCPKAKGNEQGLMLMLLSDGDFGDTQQSPLPGFKPVIQDGVQHWQGSINGLEVVLHCVMTGKPLRRGGWDLKQGCPGVMKSYVPAGSCYFIKPLEGTLTEALALHGTRIGDQTSWGYGQIACGLWI
ncbi:type III-B CRISPR module-associated Cmr3 family protein [Endozoicomonas sp. 2B-B]